MGILKSLLVVVLGALCLNTFADTRPDAAPVPWPWPWAVGCPIKWESLNNDWELPDVSEGQYVAISVSKVSGAPSSVGVHVRRSDNQGLHSDGFKIVPKSKRNVLVYMTPQRKGVKPYFVQIGMVLYQSYQVDSCNSGNVVTLMSIVPINQGKPVTDSPDQSNYVLDPNYH